MILSMTGFGRSRKEGASYTVSVEMRSLNAKQLDISVRVPKNFFEGKPCHARLNIALCPAAHALRCTFDGSVCPVKKAGTKSAHSSQVAAAEKTSGATRSQCRIFEKNHSEE